VVPARLRQHDPRQQIQITARARTVISRALSETRLATVSLGAREPSANSSIERAVDRYARCLPAAAGGNRMREMNLVIEGRVVGAHGLQHVDREATMVVLNLMGRPR
jgi:hypothetical protein